MITKKLKNSKVEFYKKYHEEHAEYGTGAVHLLDEVSIIIDATNPSIVLDYGCGKGALVSALQKKYPRIAFFGYDPAIPGRDTLPVQKADLVINTDVLEHIPEDELPEVVEQISSISQHVFFSLHHGKAAAVLENGENAHCTVKPQSWYLDLFHRYFSEDCTTLPADRDIESGVCTFRLPEAARARYEILISEKRKRNQDIEKIERTNRKKIAKLKRWLLGNYEYTYMRFEHRSLYDLEKEYGEASSCAMAMNALITVCTGILAVMMILGCYDSIAAQIYGSPMFLEGYEFFEDISLATLLVSLVVICKLRSAALKSKVMEALIADKRRA